MLVIHQTAWKETDLIVSVQNVSMLRKMCLLCCQWFCHFTVNVQNLLMPKKFVSPVVSRSVICVIASLTKYLSKEGKLWKKSFCVPDSGKPSFDLVHLIDLLAIILIFT